MIRSTEEVISDLKKLIDTKGFIYSMCLILFEDFHMNLYKMQDVDYRSRLSVKECSLIIGFMVQKELNFSIPTSPEEVFALKEKTYELMQELQSSLNAPQFTKLRDMMERQMDGETFEDTFEDRLNFFVKDSGMVEPMFYAGDGVYDFHYLEYLDSKYKYDRAWLTENKSFDIGKTKQIVDKIKQNLGTKAQRVHPVNLKEIFPKFIKKVSKSLGGQFSKENIQEIERQQLTAATFYQYRQLFPNPEDVEGDNSENWKKFYENLLGLFIIGPSDFADIDEHTIHSFFRNFSFSPACNEDYEGPGYFNLLNSRPLIKLEGDNYFAPINYLIAEAAYESPFYWMWEDKAYRDSLAKHRGEVGEEIACDLLTKVFGKDNTYRSVNVEIKKGRRETDIDVLCLLGNKALCVQVKSKKLTLTAKRGDFDQLSKDFKGAVQDAYNQGIVSRDAILNKTAKFYDDKGKEIFLPDQIDEVFIMGLTTENFPSLVHQVHMMLVKKASDPYPLFLSVFDLELLVHYLKDPYDFLYYVRQRIDLIEYFKADEELVYLGYHLHCKLWKREGYDRVAIDNDFGAIIDRNYYPYKIGMSHLLPTSDDPIYNRWKDPRFDFFIETIKQSRHPKATNIIFHLLDFSGDSRKNLVEQMIKIKNISRSEKTLKSLAIPNAPYFGVSYISLNSTDPAELDERVATYTKLRKYVSKCDSWLGMGAFSASSNLIDFLIYNDEPWQFDSELEVEYKDLISKMKANPFTPVNGRKIGRNDPCPCNSGNKYKKCCGS